MLGKRAPQPDLGEADRVYLEHAGRDSFYGFLAGQRGRLFRDEDFAALYCPANGRPSVPPSLLATALVLQTYDGVSDEEAKQRADYDLRWKVALGVELDARPFAKSTLQEFRAQLIVHEQAAVIFRRSLAGRRPVSEREQTGGPGRVGHRRVKARVWVVQVSGYGFRAGRTGPECGPLDCGPLAPRADSETTARGASGPHSKTAPPGRRTHSARRGARLGRSR